MGDFMRKKRGQASSGAGAAGLVALIAALIIIYILFLEPSEREELLGDDGDDNGVGGRIDKEDINVLLDENPGRLDYLKGDTFEIDIPSFNLYKTTNAKEIEAFNDFSIRNGWFDEKEIEKKFYIDDLDNTEDVILSFLTSESFGTLSVFLNENEVYEAPIKTQNIEPIKLRNLYLKEGENVLKFSVSGVGGAFWRTNEYSLKNIKVIGDITDVSRQKTSNIFTVEPWKYNNLEKASIRFSPDCRQSEVGVLDVLVNDRNIFSGVPDCGMLNKYMVPVGSFEAGLNDVVFKTNKGNYLVDLIEIKIELEELSSPLYWFELSEGDMENVTEDKVDVNLTLEFVDDDETKELDINVNGHMRRVDQEDPLYEKQINSWVEEGRNYVKLIPQTTVDIVNMQIKIIELEDDD